MLNLQFILRSKQLLQMEPAAIYAQPIPVNYKLKKEEITAMVEATSREEGEQIFNRTWYGRKYQQMNLISMEELYNNMLRTVLEKESRKDPYSVAVLYSYLYHKEHEVNLSDHRTGVFVTRLIRRGNGVMSTTISNPR